MVISATHLLLEVSPFTRMASRVTLLPLAPITFESQHSRSKLKALENAHQVHRVRRLGFGFISLHPSSFANTLAGSSFTSSSRLVGSNIPGPSAACCSAKPVSHPHRNRPDVVLACYWPCKRLSGQTAIAEPGRNNSDSPSCRLEVPLFVRSPSFVQPESRLPKNVC